MTLLLEATFFKTSQFYYNGTSIPDTLKQSLKKNNTSIHHFKPHTTLQIDDIEIRGLHSKTSLYETKNNQSLILNVVHNTTSILFTGDIEQEAETILVQQYPNLRTDILKVAHHGSKTSSTWPFLLHNNAKVGIISVGKNNTFNHPHPTILNRLKEITPTILQTNKRGAIMIKSNGSHIDIKTWL